MFTSCFVGSQSIGWHFITIRITVQTVSNIYPKTPPPNSHEFALSSPTATILQLAYLAKQLQPIHLKTTVLTFFSDVSATAAAFVELTSALREVSPRRAVSCRRRGSTGRPQRLYS